MNGKKEKNGVRPNRAKPKNFSSSLKRLLSYMGKFKGKLVLAMTCAILATACSLFAPYVFAKALNFFQRCVVNHEAFNFRLIGRLTLIIACIYVLNTIFSLIQGYTTTYIIQMTVYNLRKDVEHKLMHLPFNYFDTRQKGDILSRITNDIDNIGTALQQCITASVTAVLTIGGCVVLMIIISWKITVICVAVLAIGILLSKKILKASQLHLKKQWQQVGAVNGMVEEFFSGMTVVKAFHYEDQKIREFDQRNNALYGVSQKAQFLSLIISPLTGFFNNLSYIAICGLGVISFIAGTVTLGGITALIQYQTLYQRYILQITNILNNIQSAVASAERVFEVLDEKEEAETSAQYRNVDANSIDGKPLLGAVDFSHLRFGYTPDKPLMHDIDVHVKPGQMVAIVGPTGAGKTTLVNLLMRFYEPTGGEILIDSVPIREVTRHDLRTVFSMVLQETWLFSGSIHDNIAYGKVDATEEEILSAARSSQIEHFVQTMPDGYGTMINEEASNLSNGQKQLLTIARAMIADPKILILDEATSSVDTRTELLIQKAMDKLLEGRTSFVIAHRLSTIKDADLILVMKDGDIVEQGNHESLLSQGGLYAELYNSQFAD